MAAFTAHVTIHVHEFSPQILPTLTGMSMRSAALASVSNFRAANRRTVRKPSLLFSLPLGTRRLPVHYFLSEQKKCIFRLCNVVRVKKQGATHDTLWRNSPLRQVKTVKKKKSAKGGRRRPRRSSRPETMRRLWTPEGRRSERTGSNGAREEAHSVSETGHNAS